MREVSALYGRGSRDRTPLTAWPPTATPSCASSPTARTAVVTISVPPGGCPPASSGVAHPAGGGSSFAARACLGAVPVGVAAASFLGAEADADPRPFVAADPRAFAVLARDVDFFADPPDFAREPDFAAEAREVVFFAEPLDFAAEAREVVFFAEPLVFARVPDFAAEAREVVFFAEPLVFARVPDFAAEAREVVFLADALLFFAAPDAARLVEPDVVFFAAPEALRLLDEPARFAVRALFEEPAPSPLLAVVERAPSRALPSRLLERRTGRERGRLEKTSVFESAIG